MLTNISRDQFINSPKIVLKGRPSRARVEELTRREEERLEKQVRELGPEGLEEKQRVLDDAIQVMMMMMMIMVMMMMMMMLMMILMMTMWMVMMMELMLTMMMFLWMRMSMAMLMLMAMAMMLTMRMMRCWWCGWW